MSFDVSVRVDTGDGPRVVWEGHLTYNLSPMMRAGGLVLRELDGLASLEALPVVSECVVAMMQSPGRFRELDPPNGWGNYDGLLGMLAEFDMALMAFPDAIVGVS